jgi:excisionase family DNA binding protein
MPAPHDQTTFAWTPPDVADSTPSDRNETPAARQPQPSAARRKEGEERAGELPPDGELWDVDDAARFLKMSTSWVYKRVEAGVLPCVRVDGWSLRFVPADLRAWAARQPTKRRARRAATTKR